VGFSLQALDARGGPTDDYLSMTIWDMADLRAIIRAAPSPPYAREAEVLLALSVNDEDLVTPEECRWLAARVRNADRERVRREVREPEGVLELVDAFAAFCDACARRGGFEVW
jgi:hypothetical protein